MLLFENAVFAEDAVQISPSSTKNKTVVEKNCSKNAINWKHRKTLILSIFCSLVVIFDMVNVAVACTTETSLCSSRYRRQRSLCSMR